MENTINIENIEDVIELVEYTLKYKNFDGEEKEEFYFSPSIFKWGITWLSGEYPKPPNFHDKEWELVGNSGILSRRSWHIDSIPIEKIGINKKNNWNDKHPIKEEIYILNYDFAREVAKFLKEFKVSIDEQRAREELKEIFQDSCFAIKSEFNKTWVARAPQLDGKEYFILHEYLTTCHNSTVLLYKADGTNMLNIPTDDKGLVIGKRGENIKRISQKYGKFFKII